jgi:ubiquinone/menaquinone biosynthesis C-methylase UbiE
MITTAMGGVLSEQSDPSLFHRVLEVGCGAAEWMIEAAQTYPEMTVVGIDINRVMIEHSRRQVQTRGLQARVEFHVMDALRALEFPENSFDLVNLRFGVSFVRTREWPPLLSEMQRVVRPGGVVRLTECEIGTYGTSHALTALQEPGMRACYKAGYLFTQERAGLTNHLAELLAKAWCEGVQTKSYPLAFRAGTPEGEAFKEDMEYIFQMTRPLLKKWGCLPENYDALHQQAHKDMEQPDFLAIWPHLTAWGHKPLREGKP